MVPAVTCSLWDYLNPSVVVIFRIWHTSSPKPISTRISVVETLSPTNLGFSRKEIYRKNQPDEFFVLRSEISHGTFFRMGTGKRFDWIVEGICPTMLILQSAVRVVPIDLSIHLSICLFVYLIKI